MIVTNFKESKEPIGGKANGLFLLQRAGFNIPEFVVLTASSLSKTEHGSFRLSNDDISILREILRRWNFPEQPVVVRSSMSGEDSGGNSFAGLFNSYLNLKSFDDVLEAIHATANSAEAKLLDVYKKEKGINIIQPAVIIQKQVEASSSGILFTTSPEYPQEIAIHAVPGFSEFLNRGQDLPDEFYLWKNNGDLSRKTIIEKRHQYTSQSSKGLVQVDLNTDLQEHDTLSSQQLKVLYTTSERIEKIFQQPMDVEFVFDKSQLFIVQARPISVKIPEVVIYDNSNIQESYCGVTTPLTFSFANRAYATVYRQTMRTLGLSTETINNSEDIIQNLLGFVKGRVYYNINNWYRGLQLLPSFKQNKADMEKMMGLTDPVDFVKDVSKRWSKRLTMLPGLLLNLSRLLLAFRRLPADVPKFLAMCRSYADSFYKLAWSEFQVDDLLREREKLDASLLTHWTVPIVNDFNVMMQNGSVQRRLRNAGIENPDEFLRYYLLGNETLASLAPVRELQSLAAEVKLDQSLQLLISSTARDVHNLTAKEHPAFYKKVESYIGKYGDRTIGELKLETETMRLNPGIFYKYLQNLVRTDAVEMGAGSLRKRATQDLTSALTTRRGISKSSLLKAIDGLEVAINRREAMRLERSRLFGMYRHIFLAIGDRFTTQGVLNDARDIFYLTEPEIIAYKLKGQEFRSIVAERKREFDLYNKEVVPSRITIPYPPIETSLHENTGDLLKGTGLRNGSVEGEIMIVHDASGDLNVNNKILCALRTDPGWAPLFPACKGVLIEKGSSLSHSVILLRELAIPTIINIPNLTVRLKTGDYIRMNTDDGSIEILKHAAD